MRSPSLSTRRILRVFLADPSAELYGLQLIHDSGIPAGVMYPTLARLEAAGLINGTWEEIDEVAAGRRRRRYFVLTLKGQTAAREWLRELAELGQSLGAGSS
jgi:DNA-binding PadR family transcriptional regulator